MKKFILFFFLFLVLSAGTSNAVDVDWGNMPEETITAAINAFEKDPAFTKGRIAASVILNFSEESTNVTVNLTKDLMPWMTRKPEIRNADLLLAAFIAGNIQPQLNNKVNKDHPVDAILYMCRVYTTLRKTSLIAEIPELEKWHKLKRKEVENLVKDLQDSAAKDEEKAVEKVEKF